MSRNGDFLSETTDPQPGAGAIAEVMAALRIDGQLLINEAYASPWAVSVPGQETLRELLQCGPDAQLVPFHFVRRGAFELHVAGSRPVQVTAGQVVLVTSGAAHRLGEGRSAKTTSLEAILGGRAPRLGVATSTSLVCGVFALTDTRFNPLFEAQPAVLQAGVLTPSASYVTRGVADLLAAETSQPGGGRPWVVSRLLELVCSEVFVSTAANGGWLAAVRDQSIGTALSAFHRAPGAGWSVAALAKQANLSPSRFAARFRELLDDSPMGYVTSWRLALAARKLRDGAERVEVVGRSVGYDNLASFSRAFSRHWGHSPSVARAGREGAGGS